MTINPSEEPVGTGQEGAGTPAGVEKEIPVDIEGQQPENKMDRLANRAARKGIDRLQRNDPTPFTK